MRIKSPDRNVSSVTRETVALILAGGRGSRLKQLTLTRAKRTLLLPDAVELFKKVKANKRARSFFDLCGWEASGVDATGEGPPPDAPDGDAAKAAMSTPSLIPMRPSTMGFSPNRIRSFCSSQTTDRPIW